MHNRRRKCKLAEKIRILFFNGSQSRDSEARNDGIQGGNRLYRLSWKLNCYVWSASNFANFRNTQSSWIRLGRSWPSFRNDIHPQTILRILLQLQLSSDPNIHSTLLRMELIRSRHPVEWVQTQQQIAARLWPPRNTKKRYCIRIN